MRAGGTSTEWLAFVENDVMLDDGWLDTLLDRAEATGADVVYPAYLQDTATGPKVHGLGAEIELTGAAGARRIGELQHELGRPWAEVAPTVDEADRPQSEPHCFVMRRALYDDLGGLDEELLGWFDHVDLGLHVLELGVRSRMVPTVTCTYVPPPPLARVDWRSFATRWGRPWYDASRARLCATWGLDPNAPGWAPHANYRHFVRASVPTRSRRVNRVLARVTAPLEVVSRRGWALRGDRLRGGGLHCIPHNRRS
ncbi:MAG: hypothetical protein U0W40_00700 [Acidimicrobiia bacterium]